MGSKSFFGKMTMVFALVLLSFCAFKIQTVQAQSLADPAREYSSGFVGNRKIYWCPSGYGYLAFCPQPTDYDSHTWCCVWPYWENSWRPACCAHAIPAGAVVTVVLGCILLLFLLIGLSCWCCVCCPLHKRVYEKDQEYPPKNRR